MNPATPASRETSPGGQPQASDRDRPLVLVVDDDESFLAMLGEALASLGFSVLCCARSGEVLRMAGERRPDVFLIDLVMPGPDGFELCRQVRADARFNDAVIVMMSGRVERGQRGEEIVRGLEAGASDYLIKPFDLAEAAARIRARLCSHRARARLATTAQATKERYRILYDSSRDAIMTIEPPSWRFTAGNPATITMFRAGDEATFVTAAPWQLSPERQPDGRRSDEKAREMIATAMREGSHFFEWTHRRLHGEEFPATVLLTRMEVAGRTVIHATVRDITAQKLAEEALRDSEARYRTLFEGAQDGMALADAETGRLLECNAALCCMVERDKAELVGQIQTVLHPPRGAGDGLSPSFRQHRGPGAGVALEDCLISKRGRSIPVEIKAARVRMNGRDYLLGVFRDITERRRLEEQLRHAQKLEAVGQLAGGVAHEFNNLLMGIGGYAQLLLPRFLSDAEAARDLSRIRELSERGAGLSRQLLAFSRRSGAEPVILNINSVIENAHRMLRQLLPENVELALSAGAGLGSVRADPGQVEQVLVNLAVNARDAMPAGGRLLIETANCELNAAYARTHAEVLPGRYVMLAVTDTGSGMDEATKRRLFEPFFTTKEVGKGTGLGLATIYGIIKQHGGHVTVYSAPGQGSTFKVYLPRLKALAAKIREVLDRKAAPSCSAALLPDGGNAGG